MKQLKAADSHFSNLEKNAPGEDEEGTTVKNHQEGDELLVDPTLETQGGDTHSSVVASKKAEKPQIKAARGRRTGTPVRASDNVALIDNDQDPAKGYIPDERGDQLNGETKAEELVTAEDDDAELEDLGVGEDVEADVDGPDVNPDPVTDEVDDVPDVNDDEVGEDAPLSDVLNLDDDEGISDDDELGEEDEPELSAANISEEEFPLVDVEKLNDKFENCAFAVNANTLLFLKANRVIATMSKTQAVKAGVDEHYLGEGYQNLAEAHLRKTGLRAGLKALGFKMSTVNIAASDVLNKRVQAAAAQIKARNEKIVAGYDRVLEQSMAIASVGIARNYFKKTSNPLRAALAQELSAAGVRGHEKLLARVFAQHSAASMHEVYLLAKKLSAMPEALRDQHAENLDMVNDEGTVEEAACDTSKLNSVQMPISAGEDDAFDPAELQDDGEDDLSITASLLQPARPTAMTRSQRIAASVQLTAQQRADAILSGTLAF